MLAASLASIKSSRKAACTGLNNLFVNISSLDLEFNVPTYNAVYF